MAFRALDRLAAATALLLASTALASAQDAQLRYTCYSDGNDCDVMRDQLTGFEAQNPGIKVALEVVPYKAILESLPVQLAAGQGPDLARVTDLGGLNRYYLDIADKVDSAYYEANYGSTLPWFRSGPDDDGIYGVMTQLTISGGFVNKTLFEQAEVEVPGEKATWEEWAAAAKEVAEATETPFPMAIDRSGHRFAAPAMSYGAKYFAADGTPKMADEGMSAFAEQFVAWNNDGTIAKEVWGGQGGSTYQDAAQEFINGALVFYYSGSWQVSRFDTAVADAFDWTVAGSPCGPAGCTGIPGGAAIVGFKHSQHPEAVAKLIDYFASEPVQAELMARTGNVPAHKGLTEKGIEYEGKSPQTVEALKVFTGEVAELSPVAFQLQGYRYNRALFNATSTRLTQAIVGELSLEDALARMDSDVAEALKAAGG